MEKLTEQDLQTLINIVAQVSVPVAQASPLIELINKMSKMIDELRKSPTPTQASLEPLSS